VRFDGVDAALGETLTQLAEARRRYAELSQRLKDTVLEAVRDGGAEVETTRRARAADFEEGFQRLDRRGLRLTHPDPPERPPDKPQPRPRRKRGGPPPVDPRQLDLLAQSPPKGDA
jgi:hypothetical protein